MESIKNYIYFIFTMIILSAIIICQMKKQKCSISTKYVLLAFYSKVLAGILYGYIGYFLRLNINPDSWRFFNKGIQYLHNHQSFGSFFNGFFPTNHDNNLFNNFFKTDHSYFNSLRYILMNRLSAVLSILSGGRYYINIIIFEWIILWGSVDLFKFFSVESNSNKIYFYLIVFFYPTSLYWNSGFEKDGICFALIGSVLWALYQYKLKRQFYYLFKIIAIAILLTIMRSYTGLSLIIMYSIYLLNWKLKGRKTKLTLFSVGVLAILVFAEAINLPGLLFDRTHAFYAENGQPLDHLILNGTLTSVIQMLPFTLNHVLFRPRLLEINSILDVVIYIQNMMILTSIIAIIITWCKPAIRYKLTLPNTFIFLYAILNLTIIGTLMPYLSHISRYKSMFEVLILAIAVTVYTKSKYET